MRLHAAFELRGLRVRKSIRSTGKTIFIKVTGLKHFPDCATADIRRENASPDGGDLVDGLGHPLSLSFNRRRVSDILDFVEFGSVVDRLVGLRIVVTQVAPRIMPPGLTLGLGMSTG